MAFKMTGKSPMMRALIGKQKNLPEHLKEEILKASPLNDKIPESGTGKDDETGTYYYQGMAQSDRPQASTDLISGVEVEAAKQLASGRVNRAQKRAKKKVNKANRSVKVGGAKRSARVHERRRNKAIKATEKARDKTRKRFDKMSDLGKKEYNRIIERDNRERKEREAARDAQKNK